MEFTSLLPREEDHSSRASPGPGVMMKSKAWVQASTEHVAACPEELSPQLRLEELSSAGPEEQLGKMEENDEKDQNDNGHHTYQREILGEPAEAMERCERSRSCNQQDQQVQRKIVWVRNVLHPLFVILLNL